MRLSLTNSVAALAALTGLGVLLAGVTDWLQGSAPDGVVSLPDGVGLAIFIAAVLCVVACSAARSFGLAPAREATLRLASIGFAVVAAAVGDPTYAALLFAIPLVDIARHSTGRSRSLMIGGIFVLVAFLVAIEDQSWSGNGLEATLVLFIALLMTTMFGYALGQLDDASRLQAELARVDERDHLARELHDSVGHSLLASSIQLKNATALWERSPDLALQSVDHASRAVAEALLDTRVAVDTIRSQGPVFSLDQALPGLLDRLSSPTLTTDLTLTGDLDTVDQLTQITLYRVAQEALTNAVRHAEASHIDVTNAVTDGNVCLVVADNGRGFDVDADAMHAGLQSLSERMHRVGGSLDVASTVDSGTTLTATVSLDR